VGCVGQVWRDVRRVESAQREGRSLAAVGAVQDDHGGRPVAVAERAHLEIRPARCCPDPQYARADEAAVARERPQSTRGSDRVAGDLNGSRVGAGHRRRARIRSPQVEERARSAAVRPVSMFCAQVNPDDSEPSSQAGSHGWEAERRPLGLPDRLAAAAQWRGGRCEVAVTGE
jgi:hypothetical protein